MPEDRLIGIEEAAAILTLKASTIRAMVLNRKLAPVYPAGARVIRFRLSDIERAAGLRPAGQPVGAS